MGDSITEIIEEARRAKKRQIADRERALAGTPAMPERTGAKAPEWWERNVEGRVEKALPSVMGAIAPPIAKAWQKFEEYAPHLATIAQLYGPDILRGTEIGWRLLGLGGGAVVPGVEAFPLGKALTTGRDILDARDPDREPVPFEPPKLEKYPGAAKAFWEGLTEEGDVWTRLESAIEAAQDELEAGWGYWAASEAATSAVAPFAAARGGVGLTRAAAPLAQTLARPVSRVAPRAAPSIERGIEAGIRGLGAGLQVPFMVEEAAGRAIAAPFRRGQPRRGLVEEAPVGGLTLEEADAIIGPTVAEMEVSRAAAMARGPRAKLAILQERHKEAEDAVRALEARLPQARQRLEMPAVAEAPPAAPGAPAREVGAERAWDVDDWNRFITAEEERLVRMPDAPEPYQGPARSILDKITRGTGRGEHTVLNEQEQALLRQFIDEEGIDSEFLGLTSRIWTGEDEVIMGIMPRKLFGAGWKGHEYITWAPAKNTFIIHSTRPDPYEVMRAGGKFQFSPRAIAGARDVRGIEGIRPPAALGAPGGPPPAALGAPAGPPPAALVTPDVPVTPPTTLPGAPVARVQSVVTGFREGASTQPLPSVGQLKDNYSKPLSEYTDRLFHETNMDGASSSLAYSDNYQRDIFFANNADMARGQTGKGVLLEFSAEGVEGQINRSKPGWAFAFDGGDAEFIARTSRSEMSNNLISVTVEKGVFQAQRLKPGGKWLNPDTLYVRRTIQDWPKTTNADGSVTYVRPADPWKIQATSVGVVDAPAALVTPGARPTASYEDAFAIYEQSKLAKNIESLSQSAKQDYRARDPVEAFRNSASKLIGDIDASETITVWHGTNITNARQILKSGQIIGDQYSYGPGVTISPETARKFSGSARGAREGFRADRAPVVLQFEINAKQFLRDFVPDIHDEATVFTTARVNSILDIDPSKVKLLYDTPATSPTSPIRRLISDLSDEELERFNVVARAYVQRNEQMQRQAQLRGYPTAAPGAPVARVAGEVAEEAVTTPGVGIQGTGGNTQQLPINVVSRAEAQANIAKEVFEPVEGSRIDEAATAYLRASKEGEEAISAAGAVDLTDPIGQYWRRITDNYNKYIRGMGPPSKDFPVHPDFVTQSMRNIGLWIRYMTDPTRMLQAIDQGVFGGSVQRYILWVTRRTDIASKHFAEAHTILYRKIQDQYGMVDSLAQQLTPGIGPLRDVKRTKMLRSLAGDVLEEISYNDVNVPVGKLLSRPSIARWLTKITPQEKERVVGFAQRTRIFFDDLLVKQNQARVVRGQDPIGYIENYRPWVASRNIWSKIGFGKQTPAQLAAEKELPDFVTPKAWFNPRAQTRREGMVDYWKERDLQILAGDYVETASKDIFYTNIIQNAKPYIKQMRSRKGLGGAARGVEQWIMESYAGTKPRISQIAIGAEEAVGGAVSVVTRGKVAGGIPVRRGMFAIRKNLTRAVFPLNWSWNLATQTASTANAFMRYGIVRTLQGLGYITNTATRREVRDNAYSVFVKRRRAGRAVYQDTGVGTMAQIERTPIEKAEDLANFITNTLEDNLTGVSTQAARKEAESLGLTGRALWEYASEGGAKTQSMYNIADMPGLLRAPEVGAVAPFQTFAFDMMNNVLEAMPFIPGRARVGAYAGVRLPSGQVVRTAMSGTTQNRLKALGRWVAGITAFAIASDYALGRQPWKLSSFLPFYGFVLEGYVAGNPFNKPLPTKYGYDFIKAIQAYTKYGDWKKLRTWFIGYHALGGTQINRTIKGIEAVAEGEVTDVRGETLFDTEPPEGWESGRGIWEAFKAVTQGPYAVTEGRAYVEELKGGLAEEYIGDWPRAVISSFGTWTESEEDKARRAVDRFTLTLGGVETNYSDLYKHPFVRRSVKKQLPSNLRDSVDEYIDADYAERKELIRTQAFRDIRDAVSEAGRSGGMLYYLRGKFIEAAPSGWETVAASVGRTFPGSQEIREVILEWEEKGRKVPEYDYDTWEEKE